MDNVDIIDDESHGFPVVPVAAGVGGCLVLALLGGLLAWFLIRRRRQSITTPEPESNDMPAPSEVVSEDGTSVEAASVAAESDNRVSETAAASGGTGTGVYASFAGVAVTRNEYDQPDSALS